MKILITGCAGFIGFHISAKLLKNSKFKIYGIDNMNHYYDVALKKSRLKILKNNKKFNYYNIDIKNKKKLNENFKKNDYACVIHLAAQAGVRYSLEHPESYINNNIIGFFNILNISQKKKVKHFLFASSSSVYGSNNEFPLVETARTDLPLSFYAATKKSNELMAYSFSNIHNFPCTAMRFFTVYGPYGRPDMALFKFTEAIINKKQINLNNSGKHIRDFTYIDDVVESIYRLIKKPSKKKIPYEVYNIASSNPKKLKYFLDLIERQIGEKTLVKNQPLQQGDIYKTHGDVKKLVKKIGFKPKVTIEEGIVKFINWYQDYYRK